MINMFIKSPADLEKAIEIAKNGSETTKKDALYAMGTYKWYNYYQNIHIKEGSDADKENERLFKLLEIEAPNVHKSIESWVDWYIEKLGQDLQD